MNAAVNGLPPGYPTITPYLTVTPADAAISFYAKVFGAHERLRMLLPDGRVGHAELEVGTSLLMLADECGEAGKVVTGGETSAVALHLYCENVDEVVANALAEGAKLVGKIENQFYGDRTAVVVDPFGHKWWIATRVEEVSQEEMDRRMKALFA